MPDPYATPSQVRTFYAGGEDTPSALYGPYMRSAARIVQKFAPVPNPEPAEYAEMAADAELQVGQFLMNSLGGSLSSLTSPEGGLSFTNLSAVMGIVSATMGDYYTGGTAAAAKVGWLG